MADHTPDREFGMNLSAIVALSFVVRELLLIGFVQYPCHIYALLLSLAV